jgi:hypothetical protein
LRESGDKITVKLSNFEATQHSEVIPRGIVIECNKINKSNKTIKKFKIQYKEGCYLESGSIYAGKTNKLFISTYITARISAGNTSDLRSTCQTILRTRCNQVSLMTVKIVDRLEKCRAPYLPLEATVSIRLLVIISVIVSPSPPPFAAALTPVPAVLS